MGGSRSSAERAGKVLELQFGGVFGARRAMRCGIGRRISCNPLIMKNLTLEDVCLPESGSASVGRVVPTAVLFWCASASGCPAFTDSFGPR